MRGIYKMEQTRNAKQDVHYNYSFTAEDVKEQNLTSAQRVLESEGRFMQVSGKKTWNNYFNLGKMQMNCTMNYTNKVS